MAHGRLQTGWSRLVLVTHALKHAESAESLAEISARHERADVGHQINYQYLHHRLLCRAAQ
jgi:hypothetical protein